MFKLYWQQVARFLDVHLELIAWVSLISGVVCMVALSRIAYVNWPSRNLSLAATAFFAAGIALVTQAFYELQSSEIKTKFVARYTIDRQTGRLAQFEYPLETLLFRDQFEIQNGKLSNLAELDKQLGLKKLASDFAIVSFLQFIMNLAPWGGDYEEFVLPDYRTASLFRNPQIGEITSISQLEARKRLSDAGSIFSDAVLIGGSTFDLPPNSEIRVGSNSISLINPVLSISFEVVREFGLSNTNPRLDSDMPIYEGGPRYSTIDLLLQIKQTVDWSHSQDHRLKLYQAWADKLAAGAKKWFEPPKRRDSIDQRPRLQPFD